MRPVHGLSMLLPIAVVLLTASRQAPTASDLRLGSVAVTGTQRYTPHEVAQVSRLEIGQSVTTADVAAAAARMAGTGLFKSVKYRYATTGRQMTVTFDIEEATWTVPVVFDNFVWFSDEQLIAALRPEVPSFDGTAPETPGISDLMVGTLQHLLQTSHIGGRVDFEVHLNLQTKAKQYVFSVKDPGLKMCALHVDGASVLPERQLLEAAASAMTTDYSRSYLTDLSNGTLLQMYRQRGYWRAAFRPLSAAIHSAPACSGADVTLHVDEGAAYAWDRAEWSGNTALTPKDLDAVLGMKSDEVADVSRIEAGLRHVHTAYGTHGYLLESDTATPRLDDATHRAVFQIGIVEGPQFRMGTVEVTGLSASDAANLKKKWRLQPGDVYDNSYPGQFETAEVVPFLRRAGSLLRVPPPETVVDVERRVVDVRFAFK
jgi:outer membrane protein assembly factor BamA